MNTAFEEAKDNLLSVIQQMFDVPCNEISQDDLGSVQDLGYQLLQIFQEQDERMINCDLV